MLKLGILGSTGGTLFLILANAIANKQLRATIEVIVSNKVDASILAHARARDIPTKVVESKNFDSKEECDEKMNEIFAGSDVDYILLLGYKRHLSSTFVRQWKQKIINVHASLMPFFSSGKKEDIIQIVLDSKLRETGCTVHYMSETSDTSCIIKQKKCMVLATDSVKSLKSRVQNLEGEALIEVINDLGK